MAKSASDFSHLPEKYVGQWVALEDHKVVAAGDSLAQVLAKSRQKQIKGPVFVKIPRPNESYLLALP